jgi:hypothetical protein
MDIQFVAGKDDGDGWHDKEPGFEALYDLVYLNCQADGHSFCGWVTPQVRRLVYSAPGNQRKVYKHEEFVGKLKALLDAEDFDGASDLVKLEFESIHGPKEY